MPAHCDCREDHCSNSGEQTDGKRICAVGNDYPDQGPDNADEIFGCDAALAKHKDRRDQCTGYTGHGPTKGVKSNPIPSQSGPN